MEPGEQRSVAPQHPRTSPQHVEHRRPVDPLEHERILGDLQDPRNRIPVAVRVSHHERLSLGITTRPKAPEHAALTEIEDLRGASGGDQLRRRR
jgi:hypothetical protein